VIVSPVLGSAQASVLMFRAQLKAAELNAKREKDLASRGLTTSREVEESSATLEEFRSKLMAAVQQVSALGGAPVQENGGVLGVHQLRAPLAGTVVERHVSAGQSVEGHLTAFRVADLDHLWVELAVFERNLMGIRRGDRVDLHPLSDGAETIEGQVAHVGEQIDPATRTATVRVEVDNRERKLRPGQAVTAKIQASGAVEAKVALVPHGAITFVDGKPTVFVAQSDLRFVSTPVELGEGDANDRQVISGLNAGDSVATDGVFALKSELFR
jgi:cobalt-zinc-cadmium efflux system membrane fusion protein